MMLQQRRCASLFQPQGKNLLGSLSASACPQRKDLGRFAGHARLPPVKRPKAKLVEAKNVGLNILVAFVLHQLNAVEQAA